MFCLYGYIVMLEGSMHIPELIDGICAQLPLSEMRSYRHRVR